MKTKSITFFFLFISLLTQGQSYRFISDTTLPYENVHSGFRGLSGLEYVAGKGWYFVSDRGWDNSTNNKVANAGTIFLIDAGFINRPGAISVNQLRSGFPVRAPASLESIRYDRGTNTFFLATENNDSSKVIYTKNSATYCLSTRYLPSKTEPKIKELRLSL